MLTATSVNKKPLFVELELAGTNPTNRGLLASFFIGM
jgi:hypothetical protein